MKISVIKLFFLSLLFAWGCGQKSHEHDGHQAVTSGENSPNDALYDEVMKIHDEVMPKMDDIYKLKEELKGKTLTAVDDERKKQIEVSIATLDSASESMMVWMREFSPIPDSVGVERAREYLETEMEKIKNVRTEVQEALEKGEAQKN
jgi:hypothetical protein